MDKVTIKRFKAVIRYCVLSASVIYDPWQICEIDEKLAGWNVSHSGRGGPFSHGRTVLLVLILDSSISTFLKQLHLSTCLETRQRGRRTRRAVKDMDQRHDGCGLCGIKFFGTITFPTRVP
jgi:hypothetical protein